MGEYLRMSHICSDNEQIHFLTEPEKLHGWVFVLGVFDQIHSSFDKRTTLLRQQMFTDVQKKNCSLFFFTSQL